MQFVIHGDCACRVFELEAELPRDHALLVRVMDWDAAGADDLVGETRIDLENRLLSRHMGGCGIPRRFSLSVQTISVKKKEKGGEKTALANIFPKRSCKILRCFYYTILL